MLRAEFWVQLSAAGSLGFGIYFRGRWCTGKEWHHAGVTRELTFLEFFPHSWCIAAMGKRMSQFCGMFMVQQSGGGLYNQ